jgi:hypothetical protein
MGLWIAVQNGSLAQTIAQLLDSDPRQPDRMSDSQDTAQTLLLTLAEAERMLTAMGQAQLLKEDRALS